MRIPKAVKNINGTIFITVLIISMLMVFVAASAANMLLQDAYMIRHIKYSTQAQYLAEAGINDALSKLTQLGFSAKDTPGNFPKTDLGEGTYDVTVAEQDGRVLLSSEGEYENVKRTVEIEVRKILPTALNYILSAGSNLAMAAVILTGADVDGDVHANNRGDLYAAILWSSIEITGTATATNDKIYARTWGYTATIDIDGTTYGPAGKWGWRVDEVDGGEPAVIFPDFNYNYYKSLADGSDDYHDSSQTFGSHGSSTNLEPENGIIYVEGTATFIGDCHLYGGIVAKKIIVQNQYWWWGGRRRTGRLYQHDSEQNRNVIISYGTDADQKDGVNLYGRLFARAEDNPNGVLVFAANDFVTLHAIARIEINGCIIAKHNLNIADFIAGVDYTYQRVEPDGLMSAAGASFEIVSWNK